ncbi:hypothetical protein CLOP_g5692 [Closterium sp. NIES-67]|nr:hypothetical protein CLOP_g5692 [Closterium sp. NIES-67]
MRASLPLLRALASPHSPLANNAFAINAFVEPSFRTSKRLSARCLLTSPSPDLVSRSYIAPALAAAIPAITAAPAATAPATMISSLSRAALSPSLDRSLVPSTHPHEASSKPRVATSCLSSPFTPPHNTPHYLTLPAHYRPIALSSRLGGTRSASRVARRAVAARCGATGGGGGGEEQGGAGERFVVTTPLYYVNAAPHMGSAYPTIAADALARFQRLQGRRVTFVTGTDEHGEKIALAAAKGGRTPQEHCDAVAEEYKQLWSKLDIAYDRFIRTTSPRHEAVVRQFYERVKARGDVYRAQYEGRYCVACEEYKDEKELVDGTTCPTHLTPCDHRSEDNLFFALSSHQEDLERLFQDRPGFVQPSFRKNEVLAWVADGARDFSISRAAVAWGIPVPDAPEQTIYVWFDALLG